MSSGTTFLRFRLRIWPGLLRTRHREWIGILLIAAQVVGIARMPFVRDRFFAWSPHDQRTDVSISATWKGARVSPSEIAERYGIPAIDWHGAGNADLIIEIAERRTAPDHRWTVLLRTSVNGRPARERLFVPAEVSETTAAVKTKPAKSMESSQP
jgi:hypothetical protein